MRDAEGLARQALEELAGDRLARREGDRVHEAVEPGQACAELRRTARDLRVVGDVAAKTRVEPNSAANSRDALLEALAR